MSSHKENRVWPRRFLQVSAEQRGRREARGLHGDRVNAVPVRLVWARLCPEAGREGVGAVLAATARPAGKLERGAHLVRHHLGRRSRLGLQALPTCPRQRTACHHSDGTEV